MERKGEDEKKNGKKKGKRKEREEEEEEGKKREEAENEKEAGEAAKGIEYKKAKEEDPTPLLSSLAHLLPFLTLPSFLLFSVALLLSAC